MQIATEPLPEVEKVEQVDNLLIESLPPAVVKVVEGDVDLSKESLPPEAV